MSPWASKLLFFTRSSASYLALGGSLAALGWLALRQESLPDLQMGPWEVVGAPLVVVDAGHGGHDGGAVAGGLVEKDLSLTLARQVRAHLEKAGVRVRMTRDKDYFLGLEERCQIAAEVKADAFVSVHLNTNLATEIHGIETYFAASQSLMARSVKVIGRAKRVALGEQLAKIIQRKACQVTKAQDRGIKDSQLIVVMRSPCPAALVECGFLTNAEEAELMKRADYQQSLTKGIAEGLVEFLRSQGRAVQVAKAP